MKEEFGVTFIFSTHDPKIVSEVETVYTLQDGILTDQTKENGGQHV
jgi:putative ABC transport system ATP-binding protein